MTLAICIILLIVSLLGCMILNADLIYGMLAGMFIFMIAAVRSGFGIRQVLRMMLKGIRESFIVVGVLLIIGAMTGIWRGCGTIQQLVVYGTKLIHPKLFILFAFLLPAAVSYLIGTSFGTSASIGVVMMTLCQMSGANPVLTAGAVMSGIFFGDRASPASSCAHLNAHLTETEIYGNVKAMLKDCIPASVIAIGLYTFLSILNPLQTVDTHILSSLENEYRLSPLLLIPALIILISPLIKINIKAAMGVSILCASFLAVFLQGMSLSELARTLILGYEAKGELASLLSGGGLRSMLHSSGMIIISATYSGIFNGTDMLSSAEELLEKLSARLSPYQITALTSLPIIMFSCNQTLALMLHAPLIKPLYQKSIQNKAHEVSSDAAAKPAQQNCTHGAPPAEQLQTGEGKLKMMLDLSDTTVVFSALVPWCLACSMPLEMLGASPACIPFAFFLYLPAIVALVRDKRNSAAQNGNRSAGCL